MNILITNDDGIHSSGLTALAEIAAGFGEVRIVAPDVEQSSMGHAITHSRPLDFRRTHIKGFEAWRVNGTPADCVALGAAIWESVDVVLSGINLGANLGNSTWHSGTLAAAKQAALLGVRGIAISTPVARDEPNFEPIQRYLTKALEVLLSAKEFVLVNVNLPPEPRGLRWTKLSFRHYDGKVVNAKDPMGRERHWITVVPVDETEEGTDRWAMNQGYVSITPLLLDLTDHEALSVAQARHSLT